MSTSRGSSSGLEVRCVAVQEHVVWPEPLVAMAGFSGQLSWLQFVKRVYGYSIYRLEARAAGEIAGLLALVFIKHPLLGNYLVTAPFASYGGFAFASVTARDALLDEAYRLRHDLAAQYVNVRFAEGDSPQPQGWIQYPGYATYATDLSVDAETLLRTYSSNHRNHIYKSLRKGFSIQFGRLELLRDAYEALTRSMHELGSPYHSVGYLRAMAASLGETLEFAVVYGPGGELVGAGAFITQGLLVTSLHANVLRRYRADHAGELLYWSVITRYGQKGFQQFDMGRSLIGSGNEAFKMKWRPRKKVLAYWYALQKGIDLPALNQANPKLQIAIWAWKHLPDVAVRSFGPSLIRGLA